MRKLIVGIVCLMVSAFAMAQGTVAGAGSKPFKGNFLNREYDVYICLDPYQKNVIVPGQEIYGELPGYLGDNKDGRKWLFTSSAIKNATTLRLEVINDYGSEDLTATLEQTDDTTYVLRQGAGSTLKIARNRKWVKLPKKLTFYKQNDRR